MSEEKKLKTKITGEMDGVRFDLKTKSWDDAYKILKTIDKANKEMRKNE